MAYRQGGFCREWRSHRRKTRQRGARKNRHRRRNPRNQRHEPKRHGPRSRKNLYCQQMGLRRIAHYARPARRRKELRNAEEG